MKATIGCCALALSLAAAWALAGPSRPLSRPDPSAEAIVSAVAAAQATASQPQIARCPRDRRLATR